MRSRHYSPQISRLLVCALYHEAKRQRKPMTRLADELLTAALQQTDGMTAARQQFAGAQSEPVFRAAA